MILPRTKETKLVLILKICETFRNIQFFYFFGQWRILKSYIWYLIHLDIVSCGHIDYKISFTLMGNYIFFFVPHKSNVSVFKIKLKEKENKVKTFI